MLNQDPAPTTWDLSVLLQNDQDPATDQLISQAQKAYQAFVLKWQGRADYLELPQVLKEALDEYETLARVYDGTGSVGYYFWLKYQQDQLDPAIKSQNTKIRNIELKLVNNLEFFTNRLGKIAPKVQKLMLSYPELKPYRHFLEKLFESAKYTLSVPEEKILTLTNQPAFSNWVRMVREFVSKEEREVLDESGAIVIKPFADFINLLNSQTKQVRDTSAQAVNQVLVKHADSAEHELNSILATKKITDELRGIDRPDISRHLGDDIDTSVVDALLEAVSERYNISNRYYRLKAKLLGVPQLAYHERNVTLGNLDRAYSYAKAVDLVYATFQDLDPEFAAIFTNMVQKGQIDVYPKTGKCGGAFCTHRRPTDPVFILLTHADKLTDVLTLGHEMGHAINDMLISRTQNALNSDTPLATAEVASTFMEDFVFERAAAEYTPQDKLHLIMEKLNDDISSIFRQVACYKFEQELHQLYREKNYLAKEAIGQIFTKHMSAYMGEVVEQSPGSQNWWIYWSHIRSFFYVYSYASGQLISKSLQNMVRRDKAHMALVKKFLSAGLSESPKALFLDMGIDITNPKFWHQGLDEVDKLLKEAEQLAG